MPPRVLFLLLSAMTANSAHAGDLQFGWSAGGSKSSWPGDGTVHSSLKLGYRFHDLVGVYLLTRLGYGAVDDRMLTLVSLGGQIWGRLGRTRPFFRAAVAHQHEESAAALEAQPVGAVFGVGDGIRHRTGVDAGMGLDIPFWHGQRWQLAGTIEGTATWLTFSSGPSWYWGGNLGLALHYTH